MLYPKKIFLTYLQRYPRNIF